jgi:hypothetical protein
MAASLFFSLSSSHLSDFVFCFSLWLFLLSLVGNGWMDQPTFFLFLRWMVDILKDKPTATSKLILFVDNHSSRFNPTMLKWAYDHHIVLWAFPPNSTSVIQPADKRPFRVLKVFAHPLLPSPVRLTIQKTVTHSVCGCD